MSSSSSSLGERNETKEHKNKNNIRPLHQNWWPVSTIGALSTTKPNPVQLLNKKLVIFYSNDSDNNEISSWKCLDDQCAHRFAPLSEGRVVPVRSGDGNDKTPKSSATCLQCAYHGWEFDGKGTCTRAPQVVEKGTPRGVTSYPVQEKVGMLFVWADPSSVELSKTIPIPTFPLLETMAKKRGESFCFMRDLPYGFELLGENLLDLAHLPFSHHGVGGLTRDLGGPLPFKMLSQDQKSEDGPLYEASLENASETDPSLSGRPTTPANATTNVGFYDPCHVRYTRKTLPGMTSYVALYLTPTMAGKSRVFLYNVFEASLLAGNNKQKKSIGQRIQTWLSIATWKQRLQTAIVKRMITPVFAHQMSHQIFDGDGIFLHKQGNRMQNKGLTYRNYSTPGPADVMVNIFRRHLDTTIKATKAMDGGDVIAKSVEPTLSDYTDAIARSELLDRYESHTKHCKDCSMALAKKEKTRGRLQIFQTALYGSVGACSTVLLSFLAFAATHRQHEYKVPAVMFKIGISALATVVTFLGLTQRAMKQMDKQIQQFKFVDYIHAEKN